MHVGGSGGGFLTLQRCQMPRGHAQAYDNREAIMESLQNILFYFISLFFFWLSFIPNCSMTLLQFGERTMVQAQVWSHFRGKFSAKAAFASSNKVVLLILVAQV